MEKTKQRLAGDTHSGAGLLRRMAAAVVSVVLLVTGLSLHSVVNAETSLPVLETDVTQGTSDTTLVGIPGTYIQQISEALELINSYRKEACDNGYPNPSTGAALTSSDYVPIQWSDDLEYIARIRAAESSQTMGHVRTNGNSCFNIYSPNGMRSFGECLAWNYSKNVLDGIEQWYEEKSDYLNNTGGVTGHYTSMIDPKNTRVGIGTFYTKLARYPNTTCAEYNSVGSGNSLDFTYGDCVQKIEVKTAGTGNVLSAEKGIPCGRTDFGKLALFRFLCFDGQRQYRDGSIRRHCICYRIGKRYRLCRRSDRERGISDDNTPGTDG